MALRCEIVTPDQQVFDQPVLSAVLPAHDGYIGILQNRAPLLVKLGAGGLSLDLPGGKRASFFIHGGVAQVKDNRLTVLTEEAVAVEKLDAEAARAELAEATARRITDEKSFTQRQSAIEQARAKVALADRR
jgi:F-type H+-transporting ATPase subunit epsilon